ncbi:MAG: universal stress protein [Candidatus Rokuibacteriota bacterium]
MKKILHPTDFSEGAERARAEAVRLAKSLGAELLLLHVAVEAPLFREGPLSMPEVARVYAAQRKWASETLAARAATTRESGVSAAEWRLVVGEPVEAIVKVATDGRFDLIVMATHGRGPLERFFLGSVADRVIRLAPCPVLTVRQTPEAGGA